MKKIVLDSNCSLYEIDNWAPLFSFNSGEDSQIRFFIGSTPESRAICNNPFVLGLDYTNRLRNACAKLLPCVKTAVPFFPQTEHGATVVNILRGGLNFGLREALGSAFEWNCHSTAFISAQRARSSDNPDDWFITETGYRKVYLPRHTSLFIADVVATGVSLQYALKELLQFVEKSDSEIDSLVFVTIGGIRAAENVLQLHKACKSKIKNFQGSIVLFLEGCFAVARPETPISIKITDTDLLRRDSIIAPEFLESQYENPAFALERCTIYDAGSRAFWVPEYLEDVIEYWESTSKLTEQGMTFNNLLAERLPEADPQRFQGPDLKTICKKQLDLAQTLLAKFK